MSRNETEASMVPVGRTGSAIPIGSGGTSSHEQADEAGAPSRALVRLAVSPASAVSFRPADRRPAAPFLAHLIATHQGAPQTRDRRRADPNWAITAYAATMRVPESVGRSVCESR
jgi:hypothetical protein